MTDLEGPDDLIPLQRATEIAGLARASLFGPALLGRLRTIRDGQHYLTTRRWLHAYLLSRNRVSGRRPLPPGCVAPGEEG
jgi:hypothetical protein